MQESLAKGLINTLADAIEENDRVRFDELGEALLDVRQRNPDSTTITDILKHFELLKGLLRQRE